MPNLLVLGGTAWLGGEVARTAVAAGIDVTCLARGRSGPVPAGAELVIADRSRPDAFDEVARRDWDDVVDVSWQPGMVRAAVAALAHRAAHWTYVSSGSVYAATDVPGQDEDAPTVPALPSDTAGTEDYGPAKAACEQAVVDALGERCALVRAGLIGGPGDPSDRFGYWVSRFALAGKGPVLVPREPDLMTQCIDVRDLAAWIVAMTRSGGSGAFNAVGESMPLPAVLELAASVAGYRGSMVVAAPAWLAERDVEPWAGPRSLPLWLPLPAYAGFGARDDQRALAAGLVRRPVTETLADVLVDEQGRGLDRERRAGLTRAEEVDLIEQLESGTGPQIGSNL